MSPGNPDEYESKCSYFIAYIKDITCLRVDMKFIFEWSTRYLTSERSNIQFII